MAILAMLVSPMFISEAGAQVFLGEGDNDSREGGTKYNKPDNPDQIQAITLEDEFEDEVYAPIGNGILLLGVLGGAYLLGKKRKENE